MKFLIGVVIGALGLWAYRGGRMQSLVSNAPEPMRQAYNTTTERINQVVNHEQVRQIASTVQDKVQRVVDAPQIAKPTADDVAGQPSEPLQPESVQTQNA